VAELLAGLEELSGVTYDAEAHGEKQREKSIWSGL
jgi:hypothetical protein